MGISDSDNDGASRNRHFGDGMIYFRIFNEQDGWIAACTQHTSSVYVCLCNFWPLLHVPCIGTGLTGAIEYRKTPQEERGDG